MPQILEINRVEDAAHFRREWGRLLGETAGASFFQSLEWLEAYWRYFGADQTLRVIVVLEADRPAGIVPLVVRLEKSKVGWLRVLTFPLHDWGSFYGPIGPRPEPALAAALEHVRRTPRNWDILELRWQGAPNADPLETRRAMMVAGFQACPTLWGRTAVVDLEGTWESYWSTRKGAWLRRFRHDQRRLAEQGDVSYVRYRPAGQPVGQVGEVSHAGQVSNLPHEKQVGNVSHDDGSPRWDLYEACEEIARRSWQSAATNGTTLSHASVRGFLREAHQAAAAAGAVDLNLLLLNGSPVAFVYGYHCRGYVYGLRRGYDVERTREGAGNVLLAHTLCDSFARGDRLYDMGVGSLESKRYFQTRLIPVLRYSHFPLLALRTQVLRVKRWWQSRSV
jgi:CelD/BcsL family acetyltransferase involved in cellulose biosynthesis